MRIRIWKNYKIQFECFVELTFVRRYNIAMSIRAVICHKMCGGKWKKNRKVMK